MKKIFAISLALVALVISSCQDFLEINQDPNNAPTATPALTFPAGVTSAAARFVSNYNIMGGMWVQYWAQNNGSNQYKVFDAYSVQQATNNPDFNELYSGSLRDLQYTRDAAKASGDWNMYLMGTVMQAYVFQMLADTYDMIPFDEALKGSDNFHPHFRAGQEIYDSLIVRIDNALGKDFDAATNTDPGTSDFLFGGDMETWFKFANTMKLKLYLRQIYARQTVAESGINAVYANGVGFLDTDAAMDQFTDADSKSNPLYEADQRKLNTNQNIKASKTFVDFLLNNGDPRVDKLFLAGSGGQRGIEQGNFGAPTNVIVPAAISRALILPTEKAYFMSEAESYFLQAEAAARGLGTGDAKSLYDQGVIAAFARFDLDGSAFVQGGGNYEYPDGTLEENLEAIAVQKWAALAGIEGLEAFLERNRLGYPVYNDGGYEAGDYVIGQLVYPVGGVTGTGNYPKRLLFPETERNRNPNTPAEVSFLTKVWWDKK